MSPSRFNQIEQLYRAALACAPDRRGAFLDEACREDQELRRQLDSLLAGDGSDPLLDRSATDLLAEIDSTQLAPGARLGPYRIDALLGAGGMGEVYLAHDPRLDRAVAIKLLPARLIGDAVARERLRREALAAAALDHPFICKIYEVGQDDQALFVVMEYVRGETLFSRLQAGPVPLTEALRIAGEMAEAIEDAHASGFVHRDLKPSNIMVTPQGHLKVMDFGLAKRIGREVARTLTTSGPLTDTGTISGTPQYMSPEQATSGSIDHRSDLFSFGIIIAELFTGKHPFQRNSAIETVSAILRDPPDLTTEPALPPGLLVLLRRLLAKSPDERYSSMRDVRADLLRPAVSEEVDTAPGIVIVGREQERASILKSLEAALAGHGSMVLISGEPGIGKTHLTRAILGDAAQRGCFAVTGHCYESEGAPPYIPFIEMLEYGARTLPRDSFRYALGDAAPEVAKLMPQLRRMFPEIPPPIELPPEQQRRFLFNAYREFVERVAKVTPFVAVFEDLHWADESTLLLLQHLVSAVTSMSALVIGTYRDVELDINRPFARTLESLLREKQATRIPLRRLPQAATETLLATLSGQAPPPSATRILFDHTEGNPFFVESVFRHLSEEGRLFDEQGAWRKALNSVDLQVPQGVRLLIGRRLERLPEEARRVLTTAAMIGRSFDLGLLEALESGQPDAMLDAVEAAERARLIEPEGNVREARYRFVHELIRQTLAASLSLPRRQRLHVRIADAIERLYASRVDAHAPALAHHLFQAGAAADADKAVTWLTRAAQQASGAAAFEDALTHVDNALSLVADEQTLRVAELQIQRATALRSLARMPDAIAALEQALTAFEANAAAARFAETCIPLAMIYIWTVRPDEARAVCERGLQMAGPAESATRIILMYAMAISAVLANDIEPGLAIFDAVQKMQVPPDPAVIRTVSQLRSYLFAFCAQSEAAYQAGAEADRLSETAGDVWGQVDIAWIRAWAAICLGRVGEGASIAQKAIATAERVGHWGTMFFCTCFLYEVRFAGGDLQCVDELARVLDEYESLHYLPWGFIWKIRLGDVARLQGRIDDAIEWSRRAEIPERNHWAGYPQALFAITLAQAGDARSGEALDDALRYLPRPGHPAPGGRWLSVGLVIEALAFAGRIADAAALHPVSERMIEYGYVLLWCDQPVARTPAGIAAACARNWPRAEEHHQLAIQQADTLPHRISQPIARYWYAEMLRMRGEPGDEARAREMLAEALPMFESLGMPLYATQARVTLRQLT